MSEFTDSLRLHYDERLYEEADNLLSDAANHIDKVEAELSALKQELQALRDQEPVAWVDVLTKNYPSNGGRLVSTWSKYKTKDTDVPLYSTPMPAREGWKLVPSIPTLEMTKAFYVEETMHWHIWFPDKYKAMLEAAPKEQS